MKKFRLKIFSLIICFVMCLAIFSGCSLFVKKDTINRNAVAITIGDTKITNGDLIDAYRSFYSQNYYYFMYYDEDTIMDVFYDNVVAREIILYEANKMLDNGTLVIDEEKQNEIWNDVYDYIYARVDTKEKALLLQQDPDEEKLPNRLKDDPHEDEETAYKYEPYKFEEVKLVDYSGKTKAPDRDMATAVSKFLTDLKKYNAANTEEDEDAREMVDIPEAELATRLEAYNEYLADLIRNAKAKGESTDVDELLKKTISELYNNYYENALYTMYQEYINSTIISDEYGANGGYLGEAAIAEKYRELLNESHESNAFEDTYTEAMTSTSNSDVVLYHYENGRRTFFSVQHILIPFDDETIAILKTYDGYETSKLKMFRDFYEQVRQTFVNDNMTTTVRDFDTGLLVKDKADETKNQTITIAKIKENFEVEVSNSGKSGDELVKFKVDLFNKYSWMYSSDTGSLKNGIDGAFGFTISSKDGEHGSYVKDFTNGARKLYEAYLAGKATNKDGIGSYAEVVSDYGVHIMMLTGVYEGGPVVDVQNKSDHEIVEALKSTPVSLLTNETLYQYIYDSLKDSLIGSSGTFFTDYRNKLVKKYESSDSENKIVYIKKLTYKQLNDAIN